MAQANVYLVILKEIKIIYGAYLWESPVFFVVTSDAPSRHCGGMALLYKESLCFAVEAYQQQDLKFTNFNLVTGR